MFRVLEALLRRGHEESVLKPSKIEPAIGEAKAQLEAECQAMLTKDNFHFRVTDLDQFSRHMVELLGGERHENGYLVSKFLIDAQYSATIIFGSHERAMTKFGVIIYYPDSENPNYAEEINYNSSGKSADRLMIAKHRITAFHDRKIYPSYFLGHDVEFTPKFNHSDSLEGGLVPPKTQAFLQKAFEVYQVSRQPIQ